MRAGDLEDLDRLRALHRQAMDRYDFPNVILEFLSFAVHAIRVAVNPAALFAKSVREWRERGAYVTDADGDAARELLHPELAIARNTRRRESTLPWADPETAIVEFGIPPTLTLEEPDHASNDAELISLARSRGVALEELRRELVRSEGWSQARWDEAILDHARGGGVFRIEDLLDPKSGGAA